MSSFSAHFDADKLLPNGLKDENLGVEMVSAGQVILKNAVQSGASKYRKTGAMANSVKSSKAYVSSNGAVIGKVKFSGKDKNGMANSQKAFWLEYGTRHISAHPFIRPATKSSETAVNSAMEKVLAAKCRS